MSAPETTLAPEKQLTPQDTALRFGTILAALVLGIAGSILLTATPFGINVPLFVLILVASVVIIVLRTRFRLVGGGRWLVIPILIFAALIAFRSSLALTFCNFLAVGIGLGIAAFRTREGRVRVAGAFDYARDLFVASVLEGIGAMLLVLTTPWRKLPPDLMGGRAWSVLRGLLIALPLLLIFGGLFAAADAVFQGFISQIFQFDTGALFSHLFWFVFWAWGTAGFLFAILVMQTRIDVSLNRPHAFGLGTIELGIVLGTLNLLFIAFVIVQFRYFFGGADLVKAATGLSYADYARRGFFELVTVAALALGVLLVTHWFVPDEDKRTQRIFRILALILIATLFVIMVSALQRMRLYVDVYGLTELRLYTTAFMLWIAVVLVWLIATVLRGQRERFAFGALMAGFGVLLVLNILNPDALIVTVNTNRTAPEPFDARYVSFLSADAIPALVTAVPAMNHQDQCTISDQIIRNWTPPLEFGTLPPPRGWTWTQAQQVDWRTWNASRILAWQTIALNWQTITNACPKN